MQAESCRNPHEEAEALLDRSDIANHGTL